MPIRILIVSDYYAPFIGGAHRQAQLIAKGLSQRGHDVNVATVWHGGFPREEQDGTVKVFRLKQLRTWPSWIAKDGKQRYQAPYPDPVTIIELRRLIDRFRPDVVYSIGWMSYSCAVALIGKNIPLLISARDYGYSCARRTLLYRGEQTCSGPAYSRCLGCAAALYGQPKGTVATLGVLMGRGLLRRRIRGLHSMSVYVQRIMERDFLQEQDSGRQLESNSLIKVVIPSFQENDESQGIETDSNLQSYLDQLPAQPFILFVGALRRVKGIYQLLEAYKGLHSPPPLVLIGTVEEDTPKVFPSGISVLRSLPHNAVLAAWDRSLFGVFPSLWPEPLGNVVHEGMSRGRAIIGSTPGGHEDMIIHNKTGFLVPAGDVSALASSMQALIDDPALRLRLGKAGFERSKLYTEARVLPAFEKLFVSVAAANGLDVSK